jgi:hypothetical protein
MKTKTLSDYIKELGSGAADADAAAAKTLNITKRSAAAYRRGERSPRRGDIPELIERSGGALSFESFYPEKPGGILVTSKT